MQHRYIGVTGTNRMTRRAPVFSFFIPTYLIYDVGWKENSLEKKRSVCLWKSSKVADIRREQDAFSTSTLHHVVQSDSLTVYLSLLREVLNDFSERSTG